MFSRFFSLACAALSISVAFSSHVDFRGSCPSVLHQLVLLLVVSPVHQQIYYDCKALGLTSRVGVQLDKRAVHCKVTPNLGSNCAMCARERLVLLHPCIAEHHTMFCDCVAGE